MGRKKRNLIIINCQANFLQFSSMAFHNEVANYPFLTKEEFNLACHLLDQKYITAILGPERRAFRLRLQYSMVNDSVSVSITKPIDISRNDINLSLDFSGLNWGEDHTTSENLMDVDAENADIVGLKNHLRLGHLVVSFLLVGS